MAILFLIYPEALGIKKIIPGMPEGVTMRDGYASRVCSK